MKRLLGLLAALLLGPVASAQFITPPGVFGGPPYTAQLPFTGIATGQVGFTSDQGMVQWDGTDWVAFSSQSAPSFSALVSGTNNGQLYIGTGGSLTATGSGIIAATTMPGSGLTGNVSANQINGSAVPFSAALLGSNVSGQLTSLALGNNLSVTGGVLNAASTASTAWSALASGTNTSGTFLIGTGSSLAPTGSGAIAATTTACSAAIAVSGNSSASNTCLYGSFSLTGTQFPDTLYNPFYEVVNDSSNALAGFGYSIQSGLDYHVLNLQSGYYGLRNTQYFGTFIQGTPGAGDTSGEQLVGMQLVMKDGGYNLLGRDLNFSDAGGQLWNIDYGVATLTGSTNILATVGQECDSNIQAGSSVVTNICHSFNAAANKGTRGVALDTAINFAGPTTGSATNTNTYLYDITFGKPNGGDGLYSDGSFMAALPQIAPQFHQPQANIGLDFRYGAWTTAPYVSNNAEIGSDGTIYGGTINAGSGGITSSTGTLTSVAVANGGAYWNQASFPTCTVSAPPVGTQATCTVATMNLTHVSMPLINASFSGSITGASGTSATLNIQTVNGKAVQPSTVALATTGWVLDSGITTNAAAITGGSGSTWTLTCVTACNNVAQQQMQAVYVGTDAGCTNGGTATLSGDTGTEPTITLIVPSTGLFAGHVTGATILSAGSVTAKAAASTTTGGGCSVQPTWQDSQGNSTFGWGVATVSNTSGSGYPLAPLPLVYISGGYSSSRTLPAVLTPTMSNSTVAVPFPNGIAPTTVAPTVNYIHGHTVLCQAWAAATHTGDSTETNLAACQVPAGIMGTTGVLHVRAYWSRTATTTDVVGFFVRQSAVNGGTGGTSFTADNVSTSGATGAQTEVYIANTGSASSQQGFNSTTGAPTGTETAAATATLNTASTSYVNFSCRDTTSTSDTCGLYGYTVELITP